jgi:hypothetical protein
MEIKGKPRTCISLGNLRIIRLVTITIRHFGLMVICYERGACICETTLTLDPSGIPIMNPIHKPRTGHLKNGNHLKCFQTFKVFRLDLDYSYSSFPPGRRHYCPFLLFYASVPRPIVDASVGTPLMVAWVESLLAD